MSLTVNLSFYIQGLNKKYHFSVAAAECPSPEEQEIPPEFYTSNNASVPEGTHWEMRLKETPVTGRVDLDVPIHIYLNPNNGKHYVCFIGRISTFTQASTVFRHWCLGTVYTIENGQDFTKLDTKDADFEDYLAREFGIFVA